MIPLSLGKSSSRRNAAATLWNLTVFTAFLSATVVLTNFRWDSFTLHPQRIESGLHERFWQLKIRDWSSANLLILGDSRANQGVSPALLAGQQNGHDWKARNLAFNAGGLNPDIYELADRRLAARGGPRVILLAVSPLALTDEGSRNKHYRTLCKRPWSTALAFILFPKAMGVLSREELDLTIKMYPGLQEYHDDGWMAVLRIPGEYPEANLSWYNELFDFGKVMPELLRDLYEQTERWSEEGVNVFAFRPPVSAAMRAIEAQKSGFDEGAFVRDFEARGGRWIDIDPSNYRTFDNCHLYRSEAVRLSRELGERIAAQLAEKQGADARFAHRAQPLPSGAR